MADQEKTEDSVPRGEAHLRLVLVDTNCFLRIYQSPLRPILGADVELFRIRTLTDLVDEFRRGKRLQDEYAWANRDIDTAVDAGAVLALSPDEAKAMLEERSLIKSYGNALLEDFCNERSIPVRSLSTTDATLIATALVFDAIIATDEWPMTYVVRDLIDEDERNVEIWNSLDILHLLERSGRISAQDRRETVKSWLRYGEALPRGWEAQYRNLFSEPAPRLQ